MNIHEGKSYRQIGQANSVLLLKEQSDQGLHYLPFHYYVPQRSSI